MSAPLSVAIIDYGSGNLHSAAKAFERMNSETNAGYSIKVTADPDEVRGANRVVLPGVGAFSDCRAGLLAVDGMMEALQEAVMEKARPFLGICVGMQLMATRGLEHGETPGFGWIGGEVRAIKPDDASLKIPHMGWNTLQVINPHPLLDGIETGRQGLHAYFVHSYHLVAEERGHVVAETGYGGPVTAMVARDNLAGTQFHPEKSQKLGLALIANFLKWKP
jgi:glutamine amidotransferase